MPIIICIFCMIVIMFNILIVCCYNYSCIECDLIIIIIHGEIYEVSYCTTSNQIQTCPELLNVLCC